LDFSLFHPQDISSLVAAGLVALSLLASLITASLGLGGGILMLSVLSLIFPPAIVVPVHGAIQLGSNGGRAIVQRAFIQWQFVIWVSLGAVLGSAAGGLFASQMPESIFRLVIGLFILITIWLPKPDVRSRGPLMSFFGGAVISFVGMIVGATGPLVMTFIRAIGERRKLIATHAMIMTLQNITKIIAFTLYGFAFAEFVPLILLMVISGFIGTLIGTKILLSLPEHIFQTGFKILITLLALDLLRRAIFG